MAAIYSTVYLLSSFSSRVHCLCTYTSTPAPTPQVSSKGICNERCTGDQVHHDDDKRPMSDVTVDHLTQKRIRTKGASATTCRS